MVILPPAAPMKYDGSTYLMRGVALPPAALSYGKTTVLARRTFHCVERTV